MVRQLRETLGARRLLRHLRVVVPVAWWATAASAYWTTTNCVEFVLEKLRQSAAPLRGVIATGTKTLRGDQIPPPSS